MKGLVLMSKRQSMLGELKGVRGVSEYKQKNRSPFEDGEFVGTYNEEVWPSGIEYLFPLIDPVGEGFSWGGTNEDLARLIGTFKLRFGKGHYNEGTLIKFEDINRRDPNDPFFTHKFFYYKRSMEGGRVLLNLEVPLDEFFYFVYSGYSESFVEGETDDVFSGSARYTLVKPTSIAAKRAKKLRTNAAAVMLLDKSEYEKQKIIAEIMELKTYDYKQTDPDSLYTAFHTEVIENTEKVARYGKSPRARFVELAQTNNTDLQVMLQIMRAKRKGILRSRGTYYLFHSGDSTLNDRLEGITTDTQLINFFRNVVNQDYYLELVSQLNARADAESQRQQVSI